jgi:hypothetical protein
VISTTTYRLDRGVALVTVGVSLVVAAVAVFVAFLLVPLDSAARFIGYVAIVVMVLALLMALRFAFRPPVLLRLDAEGYRSRSRSADGVFSGRWLDVDDVSVSGDVLRLSLTSGGEQQLPLSFVARDRVRLLRDIHDRLNTANGYRRFEG